MRFKHLLLIALLLTGFSFSVSLLSGKKVRAASCSGAGCNGQNPYTTGCNSDAYALRYRDLVDETSMTIGTVSLLYSPTCQTVWSEVTSYFGPTNRITANISAIDSSIAGCSGGTVPPTCYTGHTTTLFGPDYAVSPMQFTTSLSSAYACGTINVTYTSVWGTLTTQQAGCTELQ